MKTSSSDESTIASSSVTNSVSPYLRSRLKRVTDIGVGPIGLLITGLVFPVVAVLIKLDSPGPIFFRQKRLGLDGREFDMVKFRTMKVRSETVKGGLWTSKNDPRITRVGGALRVLYIDEFPQWWNVVKGEMSVIGPRPELPKGHALILEQYPDFVARLAARPGITGLAQTEYKYTVDIKDFRNKLTYDKKYMQSASLLLDLWIIFRTLKRIIQVRGT